MGEDEFWAFVITYMAIGGNCYVWKERSKSGQVIALLRPYGRVRTMRPAETLLARAAEAFPAR